MSQFSRKSRSRRPLRAARIVGLAAALSVLSYAPAYAYLDPGTGSVLLQLLLGGVAGMAMVGKLYWAKIKTLFGGRTKPGAVRIEPE